MKNWQKAIAKMNKNGRRASITVEGTPKIQDVKIKKVNIRPNQGGSVS